VRSIVCRYETADLLADAVASPDRELPVLRRARSSDAPPESSRGAADGEWVLAIVELASLGKATAAAARVRRYGDAMAVVFEPRDWARIGKLAAAAPPTNRSPTMKASSPPRSVVRKLEGGGGARILLVDDDVEVRDVVAAMLEAVGFHVVSSHTGEEGLAKLARDRFDLVVLDWTLPGMTGLELCRAVRARWARLPVLFLTANATTQDVVEAFAGGADDYVVKPFRAPELGARIFGLLRRAAGTT
jgi:two-component system phosphate regulon response regulator PhoB